MNTARKRRPWNGFLDHPAWSVIDNRLGCHGFQRVPWDDEGRNIHWVRPVFNEANFFVGVDWQIPPERGVVKFGASVGLASSYIQDVINKLRVWECGTGMVHPDNFPLKYPQWVVRVALHWLLLNAEPPVMTRTSWVIREQTLNDDVELFLSDLSQYGFPFLEQIDTLEKTVSLLRDIDNYPRRTPARGPGSASPLVFAALLLEQNGQQQQALEELEIGLRYDLARNERLWGARPEVRKEGEESIACMFDRYKRYIQGGAA